MDGRAAHVGDDVVHLQSGLFGGTSGTDVVDDHSVVGTEAAQDGFVLAVGAAEFNPDGPAHHAPVLHDLVVHPHGQAGRQGETHAGTDAVSAHDGGVDADHFPG